MTSAAVDVVAWYSINSGSSTKTVGTKRANRIGIYDMSGNVIEWCYDWEAPVPTSPKTDYHNDTPGTFRIMRGGAYSFGAADQSIGYRSGQSPDSVAFPVIGFRVARPL